MALSAPNTFTDGAVVNAAGLNTLGTAIENLTQVAIGRPTSYLPVAQPWCKVQITAGNSTNPTGAQVTSTGSDFLVNYDTAEVTTSGMWQAPDGAQVTVTWTGWYRIEAQVAWFGSAPSNRLVKIAVNGTADSNVVAASNEQMATEGGATNNERVQAVAFVHLNRGDTISVLCFQDSGVSVNIFNNQIFGTWLTVIYETVG